MIKLNSLGALLGSQSGVKAMTDVSGFGLLGHLTEMCEGSGVSATLGQRARAAPGEYRPVY